MHTKLLNGDLPFRTQILQGQVVRFTIAKCRVAFWKLVEEVVALQPATLLELEKRREDVIVHPRLFAESVHFVYHHLAVRVLRQRLQHHAERDIHDPARIRSFCAGRDGY